MRKVSSLKSSSITGNMDNDNYSDEFNKTTRGLNDKKGDKLKDSEFYAQQKMDEMSNVKNPRLVKKNNSRNNDSVVSKQIEIMSKFTSDEWSNKPLIKHLSDEQMKNTNTGKMEIAETVLYNVHTDLEKTINPENYFDEEDINTSYVTELDENFFSDEYYEIDMINEIYKECEEFFSVSSYNDEYLKSEKLKKINIAKVTKKSRRKKPKTTNIYNKDLYGNVRNPYFETYDDDIDYFESNTIFDEKCDPELNYFEFEYVIV